MKLTDSTLRAIIKEELKKVLKEGDVESMKDYSNKEKYHASVLKRLYGDNQELKDIAQRGKQKEFAIKLGELVKADNPEAKVKFYGVRPFGGPNQFFMSPQAKELYFSMKSGETEPAPADSSNVLSFKKPVQENVGQVGGSEVPYPHFLIRRIREKFAGRNGVGDTFLSDWNKARGVMLEFNREQLDWLLSKLGTGDTVESLINDERAKQNLPASRYSANYGKGQEQDTFGTSRAMDESKKK